VDLDSVRLEPQLAGHPASQGLALGKMEDLEVP
jgi:hypothetical protein